MSAGNIDALLQLWAAEALARGEDPPFRDHKDLYQTIDSTPLGDICWDSFKMTFNATSPDEEPPAWLANEYRVHFRDPHAVVLNMLANPDFKDEIDFAPFREYLQEGDRLLKDVMSGDWAWRQAVRSNISVAFVF